MKNEKALAMLRCGIRETNCEIKKDLYETAIAAIEKQIPKKPNKKELTEQQIASRMFMFAEHYYCTCGHPVSKGQPACDKCGQLLDWRNDDE